MIIIIKDSLQRYIIKMDIFTNIIRQAKTELRKS